MAKPKSDRTTPATPAAPAGDPATPCGRWDVDDAFRYLTRVLGKRDDLALYKLTESLLTGQLQMHVERFVAGELKGAGIVQSSWWRDQLVLRIVNNRALVKPLKAFVPGEFRYTLRESDVRLLWVPDDAKPASPKKVNAKVWVQAEVRRMKATGEIPEGIGLVGFAKLLEERMIDAGVLPVGWKYIKNNLRSWECWPIASIK